MEIMNSTLSPSNDTEPPTITPSLSHNTNGQPDPCARVDPLALGLAAGLPSVVVLVLGIALAVICIRQRTSCRCNEANRSQEGPEECKYEQTLPTPPKDTCMSSAKDTIRAYRYEDREPPRRLPPAVPTEPTRVGNIKMGPYSAGRTSSEVSLEAVYEIRVPYPITEKRA